MIIIPLNTNASDEIVLAICLIGLCAFADSQKQASLRQVAGCQLDQMSAGSRKRMNIAAMESMAAMQSCAILLFIMVRGYGEMDANSWGVRVAAVGMAIFNQINKPINTTKVT